MARDPERSVAIDVTGLDRAGEDAVVTEALRELRRSALRCRRARLLLDVESVVVTLDTSSVIAG